VRTVIMHFFNEEYMLPWWLRHHISMFDHGILIDYASTDRSVEICRKIAPDWRVVRSRNIDFDALAADFEVMQYENELRGWKISLNVTEFLCSPDLSQMETEILNSGLDGVQIESVTMVDNEPHLVPTHEASLIAQKHHGFLSKDANVNLVGHFVAGRTRLYHRAAFGAYTPGRHDSHLPNLRHSSSDANVLWYAFSPWQQPFIQRKLQIAERIPERDRRAGFGYQHFLPLAELEAKRFAMLSVTRDLTELPSLRRILITAPSIHSSTVL
jgi:hypothetical protein